MSQEAMKFQDYYEVLGVERDASQDEIKKAYRKAAMQWHPDRHQGDDHDEAEARIKQINEAYEVLSDVDKRKKYDQFGENWKHGQDFTPPPGAQSTTHRMTPEEFEAMFGSSGFSDFFASMFGDDVAKGFGGSAPQHRRYAHRGADTRAELKLDIGDAIRGGKRSFQIGASSACHSCGGIGFVGEHVCPSCAGIGTVHSVKTVDLKIPERIHDGMQLRLRGLGEAGSEGGHAGDLILSIRLNPDSVYRFKGNDIEAELPVTPWEALSGTKVKMRTPEGVVRLTIPPGTASDTRLRLKGKGLDDGHGSRGDLYAVIRYALPDQLTPKQQELIQELPKHGPQHVSGGAREDS